MTMLAEVALTRRTFIRNRRMEAPPRPAAGFFAPGVGNVPVSGNHQLTLEWLALAQSFPD